MKNGTSKPDLSRGVAKNGPEIGLENELRMLECIKTEGWVREYELHLITGMSMYMVGQVSRRLAEKDQIYRERIEGNAGYFLRLHMAGAERVGGNTGKDIEIPKLWRHHAMATQTLHHLANVLGCEFESESSMRHRGIPSGKFPDGGLISENQYYFEQENSRKSGPSLRKQAENITLLASQGTICFTAYPYPPRVCGGINHETRQTNAIRHQLRNNDPAHNIKLVRCHFDLLVSFQNMHVDRFEIIDLPELIDTPHARKKQESIPKAANPYEWVLEEHRQHGDPIRIDSILKCDGDVCFKGTFFEGQNIDDHHRLLDESLGWVEREPADLMSFSEFVHTARQRVEQNHAGMLEMLSMGEQND